MPARRRARSRFSGELRRILGGAAREYKPGSSGEKEPQNRSSAPVSEAGFRRGYSTRRRVTARGLLEWF